LLLHAQCGNKATIRSYHTGQHIQLAKLLTAPACILWWPYRILIGRVVVMAAGAAAGKFLEYETDAPTMAAQTAYGIQAIVEGYSDGYDPDSMLFMDFRRHHTGLWSDTATRCAPSRRMSACSAHTAQGAEISAVDFGPQRLQVFDGVEGRSCCSYVGSFKWQPTAIRLSAYGLQVSLPCESIDSVTTLIAAQAAAAGAHQCVPGTVGLAGGAVLAAPL